MSGELVTELGMRIANHDLPAGTTFTIAEVCDEYGVSRTVARETMRVLQDKGMLQPRRRVGLQVAPIEHWSPCDCDIIRWRLSGTRKSEEARALREFAMALAPWAAWYAAKRASDAQSDLLLAYADRMRSDAEVRRFTSFAELEIAFQTLLFRATGNRVWEGIASLMGDAIRMTYRETPDKNVSDRSMGERDKNVSDRSMGERDKNVSDKSMGEPYYGLAAAIRDRDGARARDLMIEILRHLDLEVCEGFVANDAAYGAEV